MAKLASLLIALGMTLPLAACDTGSVNPNPGGDGPDADLVDPPPINYVCGAEYTIAGTFTPAVVPGPNPDCDPAGTWELTITETSNDCVDPTNIAAQHTYVITGNTEDGYEYSYNGVLDPPDASLGYNASNSNCTGTFFHTLNEGKDLFLLRPHIADQLPTIDGSGSLERYSVPQN